MSRLWPHASYAEEQPLSHLILYTHSLTRGLTLGSILGGFVGTSIFTLRHVNILKERIPPSNFVSTTLRSTGVGAAIGTGLMLVAVPGRMWGRDEIEWHDRSWRLLENKGQVECDDWTYPSMLAGAMAFAFSPTGKALGWKGFVGGVGMGSVVGMVGYMGWQYGLNGGKRKEEAL